MRRLKTLSLLSLLALISCGAPTPAPSSSPSGSESAPTSESSSSESKQSPSSESSSSEYSSSESSSSEMKEHVSADFHGVVTSFASKTHEDVEIPAHYDSRYFESDPYVRNDDMALFASAMSNASKNQTRAKKVFAEAGFNEHYDGSSFNEKETMYTAACAIGSRKVNGVDQIVVSVQGETYLHGWESNFYVSPKEEDPRHNGDAYGFRISTLNLMETVKRFIADNGIESASYLITGYSRGGGIAGMAAMMMLDDPETYKAKNIYCYCFEHPAVVLAEHCKDSYKCIFNYINANDPVPMLLPSAYGFAHPGTTVIISDGLTEYGPISQKYGFPEIVGDESSDFSALGLKDESGNALASGKDAFSFVADIMTRELSEEEKEKGIVSLHTAQDYIDHLQEPVIIFLRNLIDLGLFTGERSLELSSSDAVNLITKLTSDDPSKSKGAVYEFFKSAMAKINIYPEGQTPEGLGEGVTPLYYNEEEMKLACSGLEDVFQNIQSGFISYFMSKGVSKSTARTKILSFAIIAMNKNIIYVRHPQDSGYVVLRNYIESRKN